MVAMISTRSSLLAVASSLATLAALSAVAAASTGPLGDVFEDFGDEPVTATSVRMCWSGDDTENADSWTIRRAAGTEPPPPGAQPAATIAGGKGTVCYIAKGLVTDAPYTFSIVAHNESGDRKPGNFTVAARTAGNFVLVPGTIGKLPGSLEYSAPRLAFTRRGRRLHAIYLKLLSNKKGYGLYHSERRGGRWSKP